MSVLGLLRSLLLIAVVIPALFWIRFGELGWDMGFGLAGFFAIIVLAIWYSDRLPAAAAAAPSVFKRSRFDVLGVVWLLSIPFGPFFGWGATEQLTAENWQAVAGIRAFLGIVLPAVGVLPLLRFVRGPNVAISAVVLLIGTAFPILTARYAAYDLIRGPVWEDVDVKKVRVIEYSALGGFWLRSLPLVDLSDGRTLRAVATAEVHRGPMRLLVLRGLDRILDSEP
ncbi:MAG: hypothetical protein HY246_22245 [Proteobacteria bacterium]|nr:hypothetical protein [Pseudomonadota bacterium]